MLKSLVIKELRESVWLTVIALGLYLLLLYMLMSKDQDRLHSIGYSIPQMSLVRSGTSEVPFTGTSFTSPFVMISMLFALGLGFQQSLKESRQGTYLFLSHRP